MVPGLLSTLNKAKEGSVVVVRWERKGRWQRKGKELGQGRIRPDMWLEELKKKQEGIFMCMFGRMELQLSHSTGWGVI